MATKTTGMNREGDINCGYVELVIIEAYGWKNVI